MKVRVSFTVDIDKEAWLLNYGCAPWEVNADVKQYCEGTVIEQLEQVGVLCRHA